MSAQRRVGPYHLVERLGRGGMGDVWLAQDPTGAAGGAPRRVALKLLDRVLTDNPAARARFAREVAAARRVRGPCVAALLDADVDADQPWLASAYVAGPTLEQHVGEHGPLAVAPLRALGAALADALMSIHAAGVVHRDLTPRNVVLGPDGPRVVDFGIAWFDGGQPITRDGSWVGTPAWMPPERFTDVGVTAASDVWSWGAVMAYAARGWPAIDGIPTVAAGRAARGEIDIEGLPAWLEPTVRAAMATDPASRPTVPELRAAMAGPGDLHDTVRDGLPTTRVQPGANRTARMPEPPARGGRQRPDRPGAGRLDPGTQDAGRRGSGRAGAGRYDAGAQDAGRDGAGRAGSGRPGGDRRVARWVSGVVVLAGAVAIGFFAGLLGTIIVTAVLVIVAVALALSREGVSERPDPVPPTWTVAVAAPVALGVGLAQVFGPLGGVAAVVGLIVLFFVLGGDIG